MELNQASHFVAMFDESYNLVTQKSQMDLHVRYWNEIENKVASIYTIAQTFLSKTAAVNLLDRFIKLICTYGLNVLHGSFKHGEEQLECQLKKLLSSLYNIF